MSDKISKKQQNNLQLHRNNTLISQSYSGPLPPASEFIKYNSAVPDAANRILQMAEDEAKHRHNIQNKIISNDSRDSLLGIIFAFVLSISCLLIGSYIILHSTDNVAAIIAGSIFGLTGIVSVIKAMIEKNKDN